MIVTEEEAKTKRCQEGFGPPLHQPRHPDSVVGKVVEPGAIMVTAPIYCIGSACMAWRWRTEAHAPFRDYCITSGEPPHTGAPKTWTFEERSREALKGKTVWTLEERDAHGATYSRLVPGSPGTGYCGRAGNPMKVF
jgi:hypothetical protein